MSKSKKDLLIPLCLSILSSILMISHAVDTITEIQTIRDGETIISSGGSFEMGFFSPNNSMNRYVGIWYKTITVTTSIWVANREIALTDSSGILKVRKPGILVLLNSTNQIIWSSNTSKYVENPVAQLLDSGNLVMKNVGEENLENFIWQSFDHPGNTLIPGMKLGKNFLTGQEWYLTSWKSKDDPSPGVYTYRIDTHGYPSLAISRGSTMTFRAGAWTGSWFSGAPTLMPSTSFKVNFVYSKEEVNFSYVYLNSSTLPRRVLSHEGVMEWWTWVERMAGWVLYSKGPPKNSCEAYAVCGAYGSCNIDDSPICGCMDRFVTKNPDEYNAGNWSSGCVRRTPLDCKKGDGFLKYSKMKLPDTRNSWFNVTMTLEECKKMCFGNCSCMAYANMNIDGGESGCFLWFGELINVRQLGDDGQVVYVRMASSESEEVTHVASGAKGRSGDGIIVVVAITVGVLLLCLSLAMYIWRKKRRQLMRKGELRDISILYQTNEENVLDLPLFDFVAIMNATDNFSMNNKLGKGGYGTVYKGMLQEGQEIAVKRLSKDSRQGFDEFMNEVTHIAKLQHRNLVKLLGCCIQGEEKILIYEYMPNKSLDFFIFDQTRNSLLNWPTCFHIINGISRGLLYLHQDSRLRIIHRDLKASNILLDIDMNPKIADFGIARSFGGNETKANTGRVVGTYGYMSPEYQLDGIFSVKSDVFSFGVLVLEIISGKRNRGFSFPEHHLSLLGHVWLLYNEGRSLELIDTHAVDSCHLSKILRFIHVALLCVQQNPEDRPSMSTVVIMLGGVGALSQPKEPGFFTERFPLEFGYTLGKGAPSSINDITITLLDAR